MKIVLRAMLLMLPIFGIAGTAEAGSLSSKAESVLAASKRATGGILWDKPQGCFEEGTHADGAIAYKTRFSLQSYGMRIDSMRGGNARTMGFNGKKQWQAMDEGKPVIRSDADSVREAIVTNYLSINGFYFPDRFPATFKYLRSAKEAGRKFDVLEIAPSGGRAFEIWFDRKTHFIKRVIDKQGTPPTKVEADDYRNVDGLTVAYKLNVIGPEGQIADRGAVTSFYCGPIESSIFDPPAERE